jgi:hydroxylamine reductase
MSDQHNYSEIKIKKGETIEITKNMVIGDVIKAYPQAATVMAKMGIHCIGCHGAAFETIEEGAFIHGIDANDLCKKINRKIRKKN